jgi:hypothetical protein
VPSDKVTMGCVSDARASITSFKLRIVVIVSRESHDEGKGHAAEKAGSDRTGREVIPKVSHCRFSGRKVALTPYISASRFRNLKGKSASEKESLADRSGFASVT